MGRKILVLLLGLSLCGALGLAYLGDSVWDIIAAHLDVGLTGSLPTKGGDSLVLKSSYQSEEHWIVTSICTDVVDILVFAQKRLNPRAQGTALSVKVDRLEGPGAFAVSVKGESGASALDHQLTVKDFIWAPSMYEGLVRQVAAGMGGLESIRNQRSAEYLQRSLLEFTSATILHEAQEVSDWLQTEPLSASAHEGAALILAAFAMREDSGSFFDQRSTLNRLVAHLALASALRENRVLDDTGALADLALRVLAGRQKEAAALLGQWRVRGELPPAQLSWLNALALRNGDDWRGMGPAAGSSMLEKTEYLRALAGHLGGGSALSYLREHPFAQELPDQARAVLSNYSGVQQGHYATGGGLQLELEEAQTVQRMLLHREVQQRDLPELLNMEPGGAIRNNTEGQPVVMIIDPGAWGRFAQRHLCNVALWRDRFLRFMLRLEDEADDFRTQMDPFLSKLIYFPILQKLRALNQQDYEAGMQGSGRLAAAHPEWVSEENWGLLRSPASRGLTYRDVVPHYESWFSPIMPTGTAYRAGVRLGFPSIRRGPVSNLERWWELAPYDTRLGLEYAYRKYEGKTTLSQYKETLGALVEYDIAVMNRLAGLVRESPLEYISIQSRACELDPNQFVDLGDYLADHDLAREAADAFQKAVDLAEDRVAVANQSSWIVNYYYENGRQQDALRIAEMAADTYSALGLETLMKLRERMGDLDKAEELGMAIKERYEDAGPLIGLYHRDVDAHGPQRSGSELESQLSEYFPNGLERAELAGFSGTPTDGVVFIHQTEKMKAAGLQANCIAVALDGYRVHNQTQYMIINSLPLAEDMTLIVWQDRQYREVHTRPRARRFGVRLADYAPQ